MRTHRVARGMARALACSAIVAVSVQAQAPLSVTSPDGRNVVSIAVREGAVTYDLLRNGRKILLPSRLGF